MKLRGGHTLGSSPSNNKSVTDVTFAYDRKKAHRDSKGLSVVSLKQMGLLAAGGIFFLAGLKAGEKESKNSVNLVSPKRLKGPADSDGAMDSFKAGGKATVATEKPQKSQMLSLDPLPYSLHHKWKLWEEMSSTEQDAALDEVGKYLTKYGKLIMPNGEKRETIKHGTCEFVEFPNGHSLCGPPPSPEEGCTFFSFGINDDPSFDKTLGEEWNCRGFAGDPTVPHPSKLHPKVTFHNVGASMLVDNEERLINKGGTEDWWVTSMPKLRYWLGLDHVNIIKLDCEGCEVGDILLVFPFRDYEKSDFCGKARQNNLKSVLNSMQRFRQLVANNISSSLLRGTSLERTLASSLMLTNYPLRHTSQKRG